MLVLSYAERRRVLPLWGDTGPEVLSLIGNSPRPLRKFGRLGLDAWSSSASRAPVIICSLMSGSTGNDDALARGRRGSSGAGRHMEGGARLALEIAGRSAAEAAQRSIGTVTRTELAAG